MLDLNTEIRDLLSKTELRCECYLDRNFDVVNCRVCQILWPDSGKMHHHSQAEVREMLRQRVSD